MLSLALFKSDSGLNLADRSGEGQVGGVKRIVELTCSITKSRGTPWQGDGIGNLYDGSGYGPQSIGVAKKTGISSGQEIT